VIIPVEVPAPEAEAPAPTSFIDAGVLAIAGGIVVAAVLGGAFVLAFIALDALKVSVPQSTTNAIAQQLVEVMTKTMDAAKTQVEASPSPMDDAFYAVAKIPVEFLIGEIKRRSLSEENKADLNVLGEGVVKITE
jgi:hypothetical protein